MTVPSATEADMPPGLVYGVSVPSLHYKVKGSNGIISSKPQLLAQICRPALCMAYLCQA